MKNFNKILGLILITAVTIVASCKKEKSTSGSTKKDVITSSDYTYNLATKNLSPTSNITANIKSEVGVKLVYSYLLRNNKPDSLVNITYATADNQNDLTVEIPASAFDNTNMSAVTGIKSVVKRIDNSSDEGTIKLTSFQPPLPKLENFPVSKLPDVNGKITITGNATSETGLNKIEILDDSQGNFTLVTTISNLNGAKTYSVNYQYTYRANTANLKVIAYDTFGIKTEVIIKVPALPYTLYKDVNMGAQGTSTETVLNNHFFISNGTTAGSCTLPQDELTLDFVFYGTSSGGTFYAPTNVGNVAANFRCNGANNYWTPTASNLKPTRFRVLVPGDSGPIDALYANVNANNIADLNDDGFFSGISVPSGSTARYTPGGVNSASQYDITNTYIIWAKVPTTPAATAYKNCIIRVKEATNAATAALSTVKFDIYVQK